MSTMATSKKIKKLSGNQKRQASSQIKGFVYQAWHSISAWMQLEGDGVIYLEVAEDFDEIEPSKVAATQVKHLTSKNVTLSSPEVVEALSNYWELKDKNKGRSISFYFLTQTERAKERGKVKLSNGAKGLDYWDQCKKGANIVPLKELLMKLDLSKDLKGFIRSATNEEIKQQLIMPIFWLTGAKNIPALISKVNKDVIEFGVKQGHKSSELKQVTNALYMHFWNTICMDEEDERILTRVDLLTVFDEAVTVPISRLELETIDQGLKKIESQLSSSVGQLPVDADVSVDTLVKEPHIVNKSLFIFRREKVNGLRPHLQRCGLLQMVGVSGIGKSLLSLQIIENDVDDWERISFRGMSANSIRQILEGLYQRYYNKSKNVLLDDINFDSGSNVYHEALERLIYLILGNSRKIIVTSQKILPAAIINNLGINEEVVVKVTKFSSEEIKELLLLNSCPQKDVDFWLKIIEATTRSHPQLIHAKVKRLKEDGWAKSKSIFDTKELETLRKERQAELVSEIPTESARDFLFRVSVFLGSFKKENALGIAKFRPEIKTPGAVFDQLVGPYIEQVGKDSYLLCPLFDNAYKRNFTDREQKVLHTIAGSSYVKKTLTPSDLSNMLFHGIMGGSGRVLTYAIAAFQSIDDKHKPLIYPHLELISMIHIGTGKPVFEGDETLNLMLRHVQLNIAAESSMPEYALSIAETWHKEIQSFSGEGPFKKEEGIQLLPFMFFLNVFKSQRVLIPINTLLSWIFEAYDFIDKNPEVEKFHNPGEFLGEKFSWKEIIAQVALTQRVNFNNIEEFLKVMESDKTSRSDELFGYIDDNPILARQVVDNVWLEQVGGDNPKWEESVRLLTKLHEFAKPRKAQNVSALCFRGIAVIKNEYMEDQPGALEILKKGLADLDNHPYLRNYLAKVAYINKDHASALSQWQNVLPELAKEGGLTAAFAYRDASISASQTGDNKVYLEYAKIASEISRQDDLLFSTQCLAEHGFGLWRKGDHKGAVKVFSLVVGELANLPDATANLRTLGLYKMVSNALLYFKKTLNPDLRKVGLPYVEPTPGMFSNLEFSEDLKKLPLAPYDSIRTFLAEIEHELGMGDEEYKKMEEVYEELPILFQVEAKKVSIQKLLKAGDLTKVVREVIEFVALTHKAVGIDERHKEVVQLNDSDYQTAVKKNGSMTCIVIAFLALIAIHKKGNFQDIPFNQWKKDATKYHLDDYSGWGKLMEFFSNPSISEARKIIKNGSENYELRVAAAIFLLANDDDRDYSLYASSVLVTSVKESSIFYKEYESIIVDLLIRCWTEIAQNLHDIWSDEESKEVLDACADKKLKGLSKAANIVLKAEKITVTLKLDAVREKIKELIEQETS